MSKIYKFLIITLTLYSNISFANILNNIEVKIDNKIITSFEIKNKILTSLVLDNKDINQNNINKIKSQVLEVLINLRLKEIELEKYNLRIENLEIENYLKQISPGGRVEIKRKFDLNNISLDLFIEEIKIELGWRKLIYQKYNDKINLDEETIENEIKDILKSKKPVKEYNLSEIEVLVNNNGLENQINELRKSINDIGFGKTAIRYSISTSAKNKGKLGWIRENILSEQILKEIITISTGQVTSPSKRANSLVFLKLNDVKNIEVKKVNKKELKEKIILTKRNNLFNLYSSSYLSKLKNTNSIKYNK